MSMHSLSYHDVRMWIKKQEHPLAKVIYNIADYIRFFEVPNFRSIFGLMYLAYKQIRNLVAGLSSLLFWKPMFKSRVCNNPKRLYLYTGMPFISGPINLFIGNGCRISGQSTFSGRTVSRVQPELRIGNNVDIGWQSTIAVGSKVIIGNNVRIAGRAFLAGYPGHPLNAKDRAAGLPCLDEQVGDIVLEDDVWLATGVSVMAGVTIGKGCIVAAGSVVTSNLPPYTLAGGVPAKAIRSLDK